MASRKPITTSDLEEIKSLLKNGMSLSDVAELTGRTKKAIQNISYRNQWTKGRVNNNTNQNKNMSISANIQEPEIPNMFTPENITVPVVEPVKSKLRNLEDKPIKDLTPREIIEYLYKLGYRLRIRGNKIECYFEKVIDLNGIVNNG